MNKISIICVRVENAGNLGAIARVMKNFNFSDLVLIDPLCNPRGSEAISRSKHAKDILERAKITDISAFNDYDYLIGTSSDMGTDYNIPRSPLPPDELGKKLASLKDGADIAIVFGPEGNGLVNKEIRQMDFIVTIPTDRSYPSMNLSHSAAVVLYEIYKWCGNDSITRHIEPCKKEYKKVLLEKIDHTLKRLDFGKTGRLDTQRILWKKVLGRMMPTNREAFALLGFFSKVNLRLDGIVIENKPTRKADAVRGR